MSDIGHFPCKEVFETDLQIRCQTPLSHRVSVATLPRPRMR